MGRKKKAKGGRETGIQGARERGRTRRREDARNRRKGKSKLMQEGRNTERKKTGGDRDIKQEKRQDRNEDNGKRMGDGKDD